MSDSPCKPTSSPDLLLRDFLLSPSDLFNLAETHSLSLDDLIAWWADPATKARIRALEEIAEARRDIRAKLHAAKAIDRLAYLCESTGNQPDERRHCANAILKHAPVARAPRKTASLPPRAPQVARLSEACATDSASAPAPNTHSKPLANLSGLSEAHETHATPSPSATPESPTPHFTSPTLNRATPHASTLQFHNPPHTPTPSYETNSLLRHRIPSTRAGTAPGGAATPISPAIIA